MMTRKTLLSIEEFAALPDDGMKHELNEGELITMPPPKPRHGDCQLSLGSALREFVLARGLGRVFTESGYRLPRIPCVDPIFRSSVNPASRIPTNTSREALTSQ